MSVSETLIREIDEALSFITVSGIGVAVSGGGDSVALLRAISTWNTDKDHKIYAATVHHNFRDEAQAEADFVAELCADLDISHQTLYWKGWDGSGNLQHSAREARRILLRQWAQDLELSVVALGHTQDDQAETFLMRLARGSGVDGLASMKIVTVQGPMWLRPFLNVSRQELRAYLTELGQSWREDPTNNDETFDRVKIRKALPLLCDLGLTPERITQTAEHMQRSRVALEQSTQRAAEICCVPDKYGTVKINLAKLQIEPEDIQYRLISYVMRWVSGAVYRPRFLSLKRILEAVKNEHSQTLAGCYMKPIHPDHLIVMRERAAMVPTPLKSGDFDQRWKITANKDYADATVSPLNERGLQQIENWRDLEVLRDVLLQTPAVWRENKVIATLLADLNENVKISFKKNLSEFYKNIVSH